MRSLGYVMQQLRNAAGLGLGSLDWLNAAIAELYPEANNDPAYAGAVSTPRLLRSRHIIDEIERGRVDGKRPPAHAWLSQDEGVTPQQIRANPAPAWLVRAYDRAVGGNGFLVDCYRWATAMDAAHRQVPPRWPGMVPAATPTAELLPLLLRGFEDSPAQVRELLRTHADELARRRPASDGPMAPDHEDRSVVEDDGSAGFPEGTVLRPDDVRSIEWVFRNAGTVAWRNRVLLAVSDHKLPGAIVPAFVPVPDLDPGETGAVVCPIRAPRTPGTYRICFKQTWADGTYCYPLTMFGVLATFTVAPAELAEGWHRWASE